jgi:hypothetical protein
MNKSPTKKKANKMKRYVAALFFTQHSFAAEIIEAKSLAEAKRKADAMEPEDIDDFDPVEGEMWVDSVEPVMEGKRHD